MVTSLTSPFRSASRAAEARQKSPWTLTKFDRLIFMERKPAHCTALEMLKSSHPDRDIHVLNGDANAFIQANINRVNWSYRRAIMFLDPYGMEVAWETLQADYC